MFKSRFRTAAATSLATALVVSPLAAPTPAFAQNADKSALVINEVVSNSDPVADWVELANTDPTLDLDISGWKIRDNSDKAPIVIPEGTVIDSGNYYAFYTEDKTPDGSAGFGLGKGDSVRVFDAEDNLVAETTWEGHVLPSWGRVPDMTGEFTATAEATRGAANKAAAEQDPGVEEPAKPEAKEPWPYDAVYDIDLGGDFAGDDMSGVDFDDNGRAWVVNNGHGKLYALDYDAAAKKYTLADSWTLKYADGTGTPDSEGVTVGPDGAIYVATERNNDDRKVSRPSVLRFEVTEGADELKATQEWDLKDITGKIKPNSGWEAISYIPEQDVYALGLEANGHVYFVDLKDDGTHELKHEYTSPFAGAMALDYRKQDKQLRVLCDEVCEGMSILLEHNGTEFAAASEVQARPQAMAAERENEGYATYTTTGACAAGQAVETTRFLWADDGGAKTGIGLRGSTVEKAVACTGDDADGGAADGSGEGSGESSGEGSSTGGIIAIVLAVLAGLVGLFGLASGPLAEWIEKNCNVQLPRLPF